MRALLCFVFVVCSGVAHAQTMSTRVAPRGRFVVPVGGATVPLLPGHRPVVLATINGRGPFRMLVETGSPVSYLLPDAFNTAFPAPPTERDTIRIGEALLTGITIRSAPALGVPSIDGLLGLDALFDAAVTIDFVSQQLRMHADTLASANGRDIIAMGTASVFWTVPVDLGDRTINAIIDTQSALSLSASPQRAAGLSFTTAPITVGTARGPTIGTVPVQRARLATSARIGDAELQQPIVDMLPLAAPLPQDAFILGLQVLSEFTMTLDQRTGRVRLARPSRIVPPPPPVFATGLGATPQPNGTRLVASVLEGFPAAAAGLTTGEVIVALNGRDLAAISDTEWRTALSGRAPLTLRVTRAGVEREVLVTPRALGF